MFTHRSNDRLPRGPLGSPNPLFEKLEGISPRRFLRDWNISGDMAAACVTFRPRAHVQKGLEIESLRWEETQRVGGYPVSSLKR